MTFNALNVAGYDPKNTKSAKDFQREDSEFALKQQLVAAQIAKAQEFDLDKMGEQVLVKAASGVPLSPQEIAVGQAYDAKRQSIGYNPVTGLSQMNKRAFETLGGAGDSVAPVASNPPPLPPAFSSAPQDEFDAKFQEQLQAAAGNPKLQQTIKDEYAKNKIKYNEDQAKSAGFSDRMSQANPQIKENQAAGTSYGQAALSNVPFFGNAMVSPEYQKLDQAQRNFINAQLRRESGAAISPGEFDNAKKQYFPQPGDSPDVLAQKEQNRNTALQGMQRAGGAAYTPAAAPEKDTVKKGVFALKKAGFSEQEIMQYYKTKAGQ